MMLRLRLVTVIVLILCLVSGGAGLCQGNKPFELVIVGGGASGTMAGIQAARMGVETLIVEPTQWLGGMLTASGVSAIDGNHNLPSGLWGEFRQKIYDYYGGPDKVSTGWVSNTLFEPSIGNRILQEMARKESKLTIWYNTELEDAVFMQDRWQLRVRMKGKSSVVRPALLIDATELGDVLAKAGAEYAIGMDSRHETGEKYAPEGANDIIQDLTFVATLQDYGSDADKTIRKPAGYNPEEFRCACNVADPASFDPVQNDCRKMITYGKLPNNKYLINWPHCGNDIYLNFIEDDATTRAQQVAEAKLHTLRFVYYLQTELGFKNLGLAEDEYPTKDNLPLIPYYREARRLKGMATLTLNHITDPFGQPEAYYRTGIAVGDYPIDHHHLKNSEAPPIDFVKIRVPSYNVPMGSLIPRDTKGLIVTEKSISVTNIVNGATRLQPVVIQLGQAAGALAGISLRHNQQPAEADVREVQRALLASGVYLMPYMDVDPLDPHFAAIQRIGATGIIRGHGVPYKWANQTWFYPEIPVSEFELMSGLREFYPQYTNDWTASGKHLTVDRFAEILSKADPALHTARIKNDWNLFGFNTPYDNELVLSRRMVAVLLDRYIDPFSIGIDLQGHIINNDFHLKLKTKPD